MKTHYDYIFLTNTPSFYKLNLCNEIAKKYSLLLVFLGYGSEAVNEKLTATHSYHFDVYFLNVGDVNDRNKITVFLRLLHLMRNISTKKVLYSGWAIPEYNIFSFLCRKNKNVVICESTAWESSMKGIKGLLKKLIISRMSAALPAGKPHRELFERIGYRGAIHVTGGVGLINKGHRVSKTCINRKARCLYVGRLVEVKNVLALVQEFNRNGYQLTIAGSGQFETNLKSIANSNIHFTGFIDNKKLGELYQQHDVFILPSTYEPWGLVVEEALYWGLPVIVSDKVGCREDLVIPGVTGEVFPVANIEQMTSCLEKIISDYAYYADAVSAIKWDERQNAQLAAYFKLQSQEI